MRTSVVQEYVPCPSSTPKRVAKLATRTMPARAEPMPGANGRKRPERVVKVSESVFYAEKQTRRNGQENRANIRLAREHADKDVGDEGPPCRQRGSGRNGGPQPVPGKNNILPVLRMYAHRSKERRTKRETKTAFRCRICPNPFCLHGRGKTPQVRKRISLRGGNRKYEISSGDFC